MEKADEVWYPVKRFEKYEVSCLGRIRHSKSQTIKSLTLARSGFLVVNLYSKQGSFVRNVHSIVAESILGHTAGGSTVIHINGDRQDNRASNLLQVSRSAALRSSRNATLPIALISPGKLLAEDAYDIRRRARAGEKTIALANEYNVSAPTISRIKHGKIWKNLDRG